MSAAAASAAAAAVGAAAAAPLRAATRMAPARAAGAAAGAAARSAAGAAAPLRPAADPVDSKSLVYFPNMAMTLVRRVTARLPYNHFLFRVDVKHTKAEIAEYLTKLYNVEVARVTTTISLGARRGARACGIRARAPQPLIPPPPPSTTGKKRRAPGHRSLFFKLKDYKRALVVLRDDKTKIAAPPASAAAQMK
jgi:ribosomal protein L23